MFVYQRVSLSISLSHTQMWQKSIVHHIHFAHHFTIWRESWERILDLHASEGEPRIWSCLVENGGTA